MDTIRYAYVCHRGRIRPNNEDNLWCSGAFLPEIHEGSEGVRASSVLLRECPVFGVFDGMGGESCGETASFLGAMTLDAFSEKEAALRREDPEQFMRRLSLALNTAVVAYEDQNRIMQMGSTWAGVLFTPETVTVSNLGDSRIYLLSGEHLSRVSTDHVFGGWSGMKAPLVQYLGMRPEDGVPEPAIRLFPLREDQVFLICSDGLTDMMGEEEIERTLLGESDPEAAVSALLDQALRAGGRDNITLVLARPQKDEPEKEETEEEESGRRGFFSRILDWFRGGGEG